MRVGSQTRTERSSLHDTSLGCSVAEPPNIGLFFVQVRSLTSALCSHIWALRGTRRVDSHAAASMASRRCDIASTPSRNSPRETRHDGAASHRRHRRDPGKFKFNSYAESAPELDVPHVMW